MHRFNTSEAEEVGFEPTEPETGSPVFETGASRDATPKPVKGSRRMKDRQSLSLPYGPLETTPELAEIIDAWPTLPEPIRAGILAMIRSASGRGGKASIAGQNPRDH